MRRIIEGKAFFQVCTTRSKFPEVEAPDPAGIAAHHLHRDIVGSVTQLSQLGGKPSCPLQISGEKSLAKFADHCEQQRARSGERRRELPYLGVHLAKLGRAPALVHDQRLTEKELQIELGFLAPIGVGQGGDQCQPATARRLPRPPSAPTPAARR